jgi:hypothetical protein
MNTKQIIKDAAARIAEDNMKAAIPSRVGRFLTAYQMAMKSHWLKDAGMTAETSDGGMWKWSDHFSVWACVRGAR